MTSEAKAHLPRPAPWFAAFQIFWREDSCRTCAGCLFGMFSTLLSSIRLGATFNRRDLLMAKHPSRSPLRGLWLNCSFAQTIPLLCLRIAAISFSFDFICIPIYAHPRTKYFFLTVTARNELCAPQNLRVSITLVPSIQLKQNKVSFVLSVDLVP
ncbi:hypothetical protein C8F04DRAFT_745147 [Mycena alexandri]|uniref:Uncharacterized protein n=1 Tax=Mycena alexandri TaxID=1745969 RepID=A0AAD6SLH9_9AGAR|nr:hypothetical protein C8F04DRAFT_745147 [Mycena alexandri]